MAAGASNIILILMLELVWALLVAEIILLVEFSSAMIRELVFPSPPFDLVFLPRRGFSL